MLIVVADDHALVREGLVQSLKKHRPDAKIMQAEDGDALIRILDNRPSVSLVLFDLRMPNTEPFSLLKRMAQKWPFMKLVVLSASEDQADVDRAFDNGARGFISKSMPTPKLLMIVDQILKGKVYVPKLEVTMPEFERILEENKKRLPDSITQRQKDVLKLLVKGKTNHIIAEELALSECTIKIHLANIYKTLNVSNRTEAAIKVSHYSI